MAVILARSEEESWEKMRQRNVLAYEYLQGQIPGSSPRYKPECYDLKNAPAFICWGGG